MVGGGVGREADGRRWRQAVARSRGRVATRWMGTRRVTCGGKGDCRNGEEEDGGVVGDVISDGLHSRLRTKYRQRLMKLPLVMLPTPFVS